MILMVITVFFALVGVADLFVGTSRWLRHTVRLSSAVLVVEITPEERAAEAMLARAANLVALDPELHGVPMVVLCQDSGENGRICSSFCADNNIPLLGSWEEIGGILHR